VAARKLKPREARCWPQAPAVAPAQPRPERQNGENSAAARHRHAPNPARDKERDIAEARANEAHPSRPRSTDGIEHPHNSPDRAGDRVAHGEQGAGDRVPDRADGRLTLGPAPLPRQVPAFDRLLPFALPLQPLRQPLAIRLDRRGLGREPALMVAQVFLRRGQDLAGTDHGLLDHGDRGLEGGRRLPIEVPIQRPRAFLTHRTGHVMRLLSTAAVPLIRPNNHSNAREARMTLVEAPLPTWKPELQ
jgi:hypothetical protein